MIALRVERFGFDPDATWGRLLLTGRQGGFVTVEPPWVYNRPSVSCLPPGVYDLEPHHSEAYPHSWALVGDGVAHFDDGVSARSTCLLHVANWAHQLRGCIGPGSSIRMIQGTLGVSHSLLTMRAIDAYLMDLRERNPQIEITEGRG